MRQELASARAYANMGRKSFSAIVHLCGLQPERNSWKNWIDGAKNRLLLVQYGAARVSPYSKEIATASDILIKAKPCTIAKYSKSLVLLDGTTEEGKQVTYTWFVGKDNKLRSSFFVEGQWAGNFSPLLSGISILVDIVANNSIKKQYTINNSKIITNNIFRTIWLPEENIIKDLSDTSKDVLRMLNHEW